MNIALFTGCRDQYYSFGLTNALLARGLRMDVIGGWEHERPDLQANPRLRFLRFGGAQTSKETMVARTLRILNYYGRLFAYAPVAEPEIFHVLWNYKLEYFDRTLLMLYFKLLRKRVVLTLHNVNAGKRDSDDSWLNRLTLRIHYDLADHIFVHTSKMKSELIAEFGVQEDAVTVIPFGTNDVVPKKGIASAEAKQRLGINDGQKTILFFGNLGPYKGVELLIAAFQRLRAANPNYRLIVAGKPRGGCEGYAARLRTTIETSGFQADVQFRGEFIPDDEIETYFQAADVLVLPYRSISQSGVLFLGQGFGLPVIATDVGSFSEHVIEGQTGFLCRPGDPHSLAEAIEKYFASDLYHRLGEHRQAIQEHVRRRHSWQTVADLTASVYERLLKHQEVIRPDAGKFQEDRS